ncbi:DUF3618 domain-containing protein [Micromonospora sp. NPDC005806]|uniref:DUF3618 domain-containing protein n=1 Tax=Micromonospora sp. NPDC005806 TaxID=3364234 RepID=UPI00367F4099
MTGNGTGDVAALREEIRRTRVELGETMELLAARADVKALLRQSAEQAKSRMREQAALTMARMRGRAAQKARLVRAQSGAVGRGPLPWAAVAVGAVATAVVLVIVRGRRR